MRPGRGCFSRERGAFVRAADRSRYIGPGHAWIWWTILTPAVGGLVAGLGLAYWVPAAAGSGIPQVKTADTFRAGAVTMKETLGKFVLCTLQLGSGASLGVEGPTVQICAGVSSFLVRMARLSPGNQKRMTSVGMAAGIAAAFNAPIAAITFTLEESIGSLDRTMLSGVIVAAALAAVVEHNILGSSPIFFVPRLETYTLAKSSLLVWYALLGLPAAIVSVAFTDSLLEQDGIYLDQRHKPYGGGTAVMPTREMSAKASEALPQQAP